MLIEFRQDATLKEMVDSGFFWVISKNVVGYLYYDRHVGIGFISKTYFYWGCLEPGNLSSYPFTYDSEIVYEHRPIYRTRRDLMEPHLTPLRVGITKKLGDKEPILAESDTHYTVILMDHRDRKHNEPVELAGRKCYLRKKGDLEKVLPSVSIAEQERRQGEFICFI